MRSLRIVEGAGTLDLALVLAHAKGALAEREGRHVKLPRIHFVRPRAPVLLGAGALVFAIVYVLLFVAVGRSAAPFERGYTVAGTGRTLYIYAEVLAINATKGTAQVRFSFANARGDHGTQFSGTSDRDMLIEIGDADTEQRVDIRAGQPMAAVDIAPDLTGSVNGYPFDRYSATLYIRAFETRRADRARSIPLNVIVGESIDEWDVTSSEHTSGPDARFDLRIRRAPPIVFFAAVMYAAMALVAVVALAIGSLIFLKLRKIEVTLVSALGAMLFALPAVRNILPGAPPLGVGADITVFLWAETAIAVSLGLFVYSWVKRGPAP